MQITIKAPENLPQDIITKRVKAVEEKLRKDAESYTRKKDRSNNDPWTNPNIEISPVDTGREDGSVNHDHYLYGSPKRK